MRHAKAEPWPPPTSTASSPTAGRADAARPGAWLREAGLVPDHAMVSAAVRTVQTWEALAAGAGWEPASRSLRPRRSTPPARTTALDLIRETSPDAVRTLVVVGHNPTMAYLAQLLDDGDGDAGRGDRG